MPSVERVLYIEEAIRAERWATREVGWTEVDTVAPLWRRHGRQLHLVVDQHEILSGWTEVRCVWNRG